MDHHVVYRQVRMFVPVVGGLLVVELVNGVILPQQVVIFQGIGFLEEFVRTILQIAERVQVDHRFVLELVTLVAQTEHFLQEVVVLITLGI